MAQNSGAQRSIEGAYTVARLLDERLHKRACLLATSLKRFIKAYNSGASEELAVRTAAEAARLQKKGKRKKKKPQEKPKDAKPKKKVEPPTVLAWKALFADLDERINKQKRCKPEDLCGAVLQLEPHERQDLCAILAVASPKTFKSFNWNEPSLLIKSALFSAMASWDYLQPKVSMMERQGVTRLVRVSQPGVTRSRGCELALALQMGYSVAEALSAGYGRQEVAASCTALPALKDAGFSVAEVVAAGQFGLEGRRGIKELVDMGYSLSDIHGSGCFSCWDFQQAGCTAADVEQLGFRKEELEAAGFVPPLRQPLEPMSAACRALKLKNGKGADGPVMISEGPAKSAATKQHTSAIRGSVLDPSAVAAAANPGQPNTRLAKTTTPQLIPGMLTRNTMASTMLDRSAASSMHGGVDKGSMSVREMSIRAKSVIGGALPLAPHVPVTIGRSVGLVASLMLDHALT